jgi:hypothetical protein
VTTIRVDFYGLTLEVTSENVAVGAAVHDRLRRFPGARDRRPDLRFNYYDRGEAINRPAGEGRPVYDTPRGEVTYFPSGDHLYVDAGQGVHLLAEPSAGRACVSLGRRRPPDLWLLSRPMFTLPLLESVKRRGRFGLHAAGVALEGQGILLPGGSGTGKSTLAIALVRAGMDFLGDDMVFLCPVNGGVRGLAFPDDIDFTDATARFFPELDALPRRGVRDSWPKRQVSVDRLAGVRLAFDCRPCALVFPRIGTAASSRLEPITPPEALLELAPNVLLTDPSSSQAHLDVLTLLVRQCACFRLYTGQDFEALADRLGALVAQASPSA